MITNLKTQHKNIIVKDIRVPLETPVEEVLNEAKKRIQTSFSSQAVLSAQIHRKSVDARKKDRISFVYSVLLTLDPQYMPSADSPEKWEILQENLTKNGADFLKEDTDFPHPGSHPLDAPPVVVGFGPCGMFAALLLAEHGYTPIVLERGDNVHNRKIKTERFKCEGMLDTESNIQFGAGGAGTFSDGKLLTRVNDPKCSYILKRFHEFGAPDEILYLAKPHIGTDILPTIVQNIEDRIVSLGGKILYNTKLTEIQIQNGHAVAAITNRGVIPCGALILAPGHSARDTFSMLMQKSFEIHPKSFSVGVRIEHLQRDIDAALYGKFAGHPLLSPAEYSLSYREGERGIYSFCMCPGGEVAAAASEENGVVTNGMSPYHRDGSNANSAIAVSVVPSDYGNTPLSAMEFQRHLEQAAFTLGGKNYFAPCQTVGNFLDAAVDNRIQDIRPTYRDGQVTMTDLKSALPSYIVSLMEKGLPVFGKKISGFDKKSALLTGFETRTSSPLRILRTDDMLAIGYKNIYPAGEGAGYAGGITSAALDGLHVAIQMIQTYKPCS